MKYIKYSKDKNKINEILKEDKRFSRLERNAFNVISICTNSNLKVSSNEEVIDMCQAILDMKKEAENKGINEGLTKVALNLVKLGKMSLEEISDVTGLPLEEIKNLSLKKNNSIFTL